MLVSWAPCLITNTDGTTSICNSSNTTGTNVVQAPPPYTIWIYDFGAGTLSPVLSSTTGVEIVEPVILQARTPLPAYIPDYIPSTTAAQNMATAQVGLLDISSVYDFDGTDSAVPNIAALANPQQAAFYTRPARFVRIEKAVEIPDKTVRKINASAFGPAGMGMREILGYAPVQPDGSVQIQVPANVPFTIDVLDQNARRITSQHTSWMQLLPGETKSCNGCHSTAAGTSHGRSGLSTAVNTGAPTTGSPFPEYQSATCSPMPGETMAQTLARISCTKGSAMPCSQIMTTDVLYTTPTDPTHRRPAWYGPSNTTLPAGDVDTPIAYYLSPLLEETGRAAHQCQLRALERAVPHNHSLCQRRDPHPRVLAEHLEPRRTGTGTSTIPVANDGLTVGSPAVCVTCHAGVSNAAAIQVPSGQLDLTGSQDTADTTVVTSYESLLFPGDEQQLNMGVLQNVLIGGQPVALAAPMTAGSANASTAFFRMFDGTFKDPVLDHTGFLTPAELRLISEWLDIGGQFYNDPFVAPVAN